MRILYLDIFGIWTMYQCNPIIIPYTDSRIIRSWQRYIPVCQCLLHMDCDWCSIYHFQHGAKQYPKNLSLIHIFFCGEGITKAYNSESSVHGMQQTVDVCKEDFHGLCFTNLVDFDTLWGHRRNPVGYAKEIEKFDVGLGNLLEVLKEDDLLIITADHGNDPTYTGTDHTLSLIHIYRSFHHHIL